jgi:hypothetical protein
MVRADDESMRDCTAHLLSICEPIGSRKLAGAAVQWPSPAGPREVNHAR